MDPLEQFKQECSQFPPQYTPEWFARVDSIGGSEMHDLLSEPMILAAKKIRSLIVAKQISEAPAHAPELAPAAEEEPEPDQESASSLTSATASASSSTMTPVARGELVSTMDEIQMINSPIVKTPQTTRGELVSTMDEIQMIAPAGSSAPPEAAPQREPTEVSEVVDEPLDDALDIRKISMSGPVAMGWGTLFEPLLCNYLAGRLHLTIDCRTVSYFKNPWRFSPDGIFRDSAGDCALLEMKNPFRRIWDGWVPEHGDQLDGDDPHAFAESRADAVPTNYMPQLQMGLHLFPFLKYALYVEALYRRATRPCEGKGARSYGIGMQKMQKVRDAAIIDAGIIGIYHPSGCGDRAKAHNFGSIGNDLLLCHVLTHQRSGADSYVPLYFAQTPDTKSTGTGTSLEVNCLPVFKNIDDLPLQFDGKPLFGYLPWHLHGLHAAKIMRNPSFLTESMQKNAQFIATFVRACKQLPSIEQKIAALRQLRDIAAKSGDRQALGIEDIINKLPVSQKGTSKEVSLIS